MRAAQHVASIWRSTVRTATASTAARASGERCDQWVRSRAVDGKKKERVSVEEAEIRQGKAREQTRAADSMWTVAELTAVRVAAVDVVAAAAGCDRRSEGRLLLVGDMREARRWIHCVTRLGRWYTVSTASPTSPTVSERRGQ